MIGKTLGTFECTELLGKGGMGEVYKAKDQKLGRDVAIKVLPEEFAKDTDRVARFQREAKLLASLNHPNIAGIYGLEESNGTHFLVLELIEGDTLADRLKHGAIPVEEALKLALQIAEALEAAHEKEVIHRDLKPANIKVTPDGKVKVLDFGLAKAFAGDQGDINLSNSPTLSAAATQQGVILGTAAYMSPEQARGENVNKGADVWAFGAVLFEMLTGRQVFAGKTVSDTLASVLAREPEWQSLPPNLHSRIGLLLERCLKKEPKNRYHDIADPRVDIQEVLADPSGVFMQPVYAGESQTKWRHMLPWLTATLLLGAIITGVAVWKLKPEAEPPQVVRFEYNLPEFQQITEYGHPQLAISPDGNQFVYSTTNGLLLRSVDELNARLIPGTEGNVRNPIFSPNGQSIVYWSVVESQLKKVAVNGGVPIDLTNDPPMGYLYWCEDNTILYAGTEGIKRISDRGGNPETLIQSEDETFFSPKLLPDGKSVLFTITTDKGYQIAVQSPETEDRKILTAGSDAFYSSSGHLVYINLRDELSAVPFDPNTLELTGNAIPLGEDVFRLGGAPQYALSTSGTLVYMPQNKSGISNERALVWVDRHGNEQRLSFPLRSYRDPQISPDGTKLALVDEDNTKYDILILDLVGGMETKLTSTDTREQLPHWTPDCSRIAFFDFLANLGISWKASDGKGDVEILFSQTGRDSFPAFWLNDGKTLLVERCTIGEADYDIGLLPIEGDRQWSPLLQKEYAEVQPRVSPDEKWMAYTSNESGQFEIYLCSFPEVNKVRKKVSVNGGDSPIWSSDGRELFYRNGDSVFLLTVESEPTLHIGKPQELFHGKYLSADLTGNDFIANPWDISPNDKKFLMIKPIETSAEKSEAQNSRKIIVVTNWFEELKEKVPID